MKERPRIDDTKILCSHGFIYIFSLLEQHSNLIAEVQDKKPN